MAPRLRALALALALLATQGAQSVRPSQGAQAATRRSGADALRPGSLLGDEAVASVVDDRNTGRLSDDMAAAMRQRAGALLQQAGPGDAASPPEPAQPSQVAASGSVPASPEAVAAPAKEAPCTDAVAEVQAAINCAIPPSCSRYPAHSKVPEIQLGTQRMLEKCFEFHNACQATAHKFLEIQAMRKLLKAKTQLLKAEVATANKGFHERVVRLVEKNQTIHILYDGVAQINSTVQSLKGSSVEFPGGSAPLPTGEPKLNSDQDDAAAESFR